MQIYLVGGAVRDELLGLPVGERDWVVVGATPAQMEQLGYRPVGRDFPVYLHPETHEEYALARLERKIAPGYRGFATQSSPEVTLEEDLKRRDLTINAMARAADGTLIDPYGGRQDLQQRCLRHVSEAFTEDPVRILRAARFAARFAGLGFTVVPQTGALMQSMVAAGEADALVPERVWREMERALGEPHPEAFFDVLERCGALPVLLPEATLDRAARDALVAASRPDDINASVPAGGGEYGAGISGHGRGHPAGGAAADRAGDTAIMADAPPAPDGESRLSGTDVRLAALLAGTDPQRLQALGKHLRLPVEHRDLALLAARLLPRIAAVAASMATMAPASTGGSSVALLDWLETADAFRRPDRFARLLAVLRARGVCAPLITQLVTAREVAAATVLPTDELSRLKGPEIAQRLHDRRLQAITCSIG